MAKMLMAFLLTAACTCGLAACATGEAIGTIKGPENELIIIDGVTYLKDDPAVEALSSADRGEYLGDVANEKITMQVFSVQGDGKGDFVYALWDWEGDFYARQETPSEDRLIYGDTSTYEKLGYGEGDTATKAEDRETEV